METAANGIVSSRGGIMLRPLGLLKWAGMMLVATAFILWGMGPGRPPIARAQQPPPGGSGGGVFSRFGKIYVNLSLVTHVIDDPGENLPPGAMQVHFSGGPAQNFINIFGDEAEALRQELDHPASVEPAAPVARKAAPTAKAGSGARGKRAAGAPGPRKLPMVDVP